MAVDAEATRRRFDRERRAMGRLSQAPGIAPLYDSGFTPSGQPWLLMPYYERGSLQAQLDANGPLGAEQVRDLGVRICRAVQTAHENGVLHRDLKPANILLNRSGQPDVADFGIAHLLDDTGGSSQALTMTPLYTAPEVFDGVDSGAASDVYSLGALLYATANGRPAYQTATGGGAPMLALMRRITEEPLPDLPASIPPSLAAVITRAMHKDPAQRYPSAAALADALAGLDLAPAAPPGSGTEPKGRRGLLVLASILVLALAVGGGLLASGALTIDDDPVVAPAPDPTVTPTAPPEPSVTPTPTPVPDAPDPAFDPAAAITAGAQGTVVVEAFSCTGAEVAVGVLLNDGLVVTSSQVLRSPWFIAVSNDVTSATAEPLTSDLTRSLGMIRLDADAGAAFDPPTRAAVSDGTALLFYDPAGAHVQQFAMLRPDGQRLAADVDPDTVALGNPVFDENGRLVGLAVPAPDEVGVLTLTEIEEEWNRSAPVRSCPTLARDLGPDDADQARSPEIAELLQLQRLSNAYANEEWELVRELEPGKVPLTDQQFIDGWRPLRQGFIWPVARTVRADGVSSWRLGLIGHETWDATDLTTLFCVTWTVDPATGDIEQTNADTVRIFGSQPGQPLQTGFVDPSQFATRIEDECRVA